MKFYMKYYISLKNYKSDFANRQINDYNSTVFIDMLQSKYQFFFL